MPLADDLPESGFLDIHCHLLPGIDDGCKTLADTIACIRQWQAAGFIGAVCTPHMATTWFPENTPGRVKDWTASLGEELRTAGINFRLWPGGEVRLSERLLDWFRQHGIPTLGDSRCVLVDWWGNDWPDYCVEACDYLVRQGYQPILAHPERMGLDANELDAAISQLRTLGVWLQGNLNSLAGGEGTQAKQRADDYLVKDQYYVLASDTHDPGSTPSRVSGLKAVQELSDAATLDRLLAQRTREILAF